MNSNYLEDPGNVNLPREFDDDDLYKPKSARLYNSPYLHLPFSPAPPSNGVFSRETTSTNPRRKSARSGRASQRCGMAVPYRGSTYIPPEIGLSYVERTKQTSRRDMDYNRSIVRKYTKKETLPSYKFSMKNTYNKIVLGKQTERVMKEEYEYKTILATKRRRALKNFEEAEKAHEDIMRKTGVQEPLYNF